ncbi:MAG: diaminopimelate decarboxylase [Candidatus Acidiferrales bacterium]
MSDSEGRARTRRSFLDPAKNTPHFSWKTNRGKTKWGAEAFCESVPLREIASKTGTPTYVYSRAAIESAYREIHRGLGALPHTICFAVKSNGNLSILKLLAKWGSGFDVVSGGELQQLQHIGVRGDRIVFSGVGKTREEMREALRYAPGRHGGRRGILLINIESEAELENLVEESARHAARGGAAPAVSIRVNPDVTAGGHPHISTGQHQHKFGLEWAAARQLYRKHASSKWIRWQGISAHIGSQIVTLEPFRQALEKLRRYVRELHSDGIALRYLDFGGGLGVRYTDEQPPSRQGYARMVARLVRPLGVHLLLEPGRSIAGSAGVLLTRVLYTKENRGKTFVIVDAGMNDLMRPALYGAEHPITRVKRGRSETDARGRRVDIVGPVCETGDCFLRDWPLGDVRAGDVLAIWTAGAYGMSLASNYNGRCRPAEVLVEGKHFRVIRRRETRNDLLRCDSLA